MIRYTTQLLPSRSGNLGIITFNHPKALHALTLDMIYCLQDVLSAWCTNNTTSMDEPKMKAILFKSSTFDPSKQKVRAFCAGGNVKDVYLSGTQKSSHQITTNGNDTSSATSKDVHGDGRSGLYTADMFRQEYIMNHMLSQLNGSTVSSTLTKSIKSLNGTDDENQHIIQSKLPIQVSIWDGMVMGGGVGVSIYGKYRIATEHTIFSMPETSIGLFPDVGSLYILPRILQQYGRAPFCTHASSIVTYLLLTGQRLSAFDTVQCGFATHYIPSNQLEKLETALINVTTPSDDVTDPDDIDTTTNIGDKIDGSTIAKDTTNCLVNDVIGPILDEFHVEISDAFSVIVPHLSDISSVFAIDDTTTIEGIISKLEQMISNNDESSSSYKFATITLQTIQKMSPTSLKITLRGLQRNITSSVLPSFHEELEIEYRMSQHCMKKSSDFYEGIRAALIDKDYKPKWHPPSIHEISLDAVQSYTHPIHNEWKLPKEYDLLPCHANSNDQSKL